MKKNLLDNMSGQEIKELIDNGMINLKELQTPALEKILNFEIDMLCYGTGNMDIIRQCSEILDGRNQSDKLKQDEILDIINKTKSEYVTIINTDNNPSVVAPQRKRRVILRKVALIAAIVATMLVSSLLVASAFGVDIFDYINYIVRQDAGTEITVGDITFYNAGKSKKYSSLEVMKEKEDLDILYPTKLPEGVYIDSVKVMNGYFSEKQIIIFTTDSSIRITIDIKYEETEPTFRNTKSFKVGDYTFHINGNDAVCYYKENFYSIKADNYDNLITILKGIKE